MEKFSSIVGPQGEIDLPPEFCAKFGIVEGTWMEFLEENGKLIVQPVHDSIEERESSGSEDSDAGA